MSLDNFRYPLRIALLVALTIPSLLDLFGPRLSTGSHPFLIFAPFGTLAGVLSLLFGGKKHFFSIERSVAVALIVLTYVDVAGAPEPESVELAPGIVGSLRTLALMPLADPDHSVAPWIVMGFCPVLVVMGTVRIRTLGMRALTLVATGTAGYLIFAVCWVRLHQGGIADALAVLAFATPLFGFLDFFFVMWLYEIGPFAKTRELSINPEGARSSAHARNQRPQDG